MESKYISIGKVSFHYHLYGSGQKLLFCFHGYGRDGSSFRFLMNALGKTYTLIAIDMPFHGLTKWYQKLTFQPEYLVQLIQTLRKQMGKENEKFSLLGFSMGGRITLHITGILHNHIERVALVAPDGLTFNFWHWFCTHTWLGNKLLGYIVNHAGWLLYMVKLAQRTKVINASVASFVYYYLHDTEQRRTLYLRWTTLRKFRLHLKKLKRQIVKQQIPVHMLFGQYDKIVRSAPGRRFKKGVEDYVTVRVINESHYLMREAHAPAIAQLLTG